jgi:integral membrane protein (TIGR01906 family)
LNKLFVHIIQGAVIIAMPIFLLLTAGHLVINVWYLQYEYGKPDFPPDPYGFTQQQRLELATGSIRFLQRPEPVEIAIQLLVAQRLPGTDKPLFNPNELSHMMDVKRLTDVLWRVQYAAGLIVIGGLIFLLARRETRWAGYRALFDSGILTTGMLVLMVLFVLLSWRMFFVVFHELFFPPGTWTFEYSTSLIRLYPDRLWFDAGTLITVGTLIAGLVIAGVGHLLGTRAKARRAA